MKKVYVLSANGIDDWFYYPNDIKPDWKVGIEECRQLLIDDGYELSTQNA